MRRVTTETPDIAAAILAAARKPIERHVAETRTYLVGELNPYGDHPRHALFPFPRGSAGGRLARVLGVRPRDQVRMNRANLCRGRWSTRAARESAEWVRGWVASGLHAVSHAAGHDPVPDPPAAVVVLLGRKVATAFGERRDLFTTWASGTGAMVLLPHPSGRCREWNAPGAVEKVRSLMTGADPGGPWGSWCSTDEPCLLVGCERCGWQSS